MPGFIKSFGGESLHLFSCFTSFENVSIKVQLSEDTIQCPDGLFPYRLRTNDNRQQIVRPSTFVVRS